MSADFRELLRVLVSQGPHKQREIAAHAGVSANTVARWVHGMARPNAHTERQLRSYLQSKLANPSQVRADKEPQLADMELAEKKVAAAGKTWDKHIKSLDGKEAKEKGKASKEVALAKIRMKLSLPTPLKK